MSKYNGNTLIFHLVMWSNRTRSVDFIDWLSMLKIYVESVSYKDLLSKHFEHTQSVSE